MPGDGTAVTKQVAKTHTHISIREMCMCSKMLCVMKYIVMSFQYFVVPVKWCNSVTNETIMIRDKHNTHTSCYKGWVKEPCVIKCSRMTKYRIRKGKTTMIATHSPQGRKNITFCCCSLLGLWRENLNSHVIHCKCVSQWPNQLIWETIQMSSI